MRQLLVSAAIVLCAIAVSAAKAELSAEPGGFGEAKFGMSVDEVRKIYPTLHLTEATKRAIAGDLLQFEMENVTVGPLQPCSALLSFYNQEFYSARFRCPDRGKVVQYLEKTYGPPSKITAKGTSWAGEHGTVWLAPTGGTFGVDDVRRSLAVKAALLSGITGYRFDSMLSPTPTPAKTPTE